VKSKIGREKEKMRRCGGEEFSRGVKSKSKVRRERGKIKSEVSERVTTVFSSVTH
jgi:hypothetical protein